MPVCLLCTLSLCTLPYLLSGDGIGLLTSENIDLTVAENLGEWINVTIRIFNI